MPRSRQVRVSLPAAVWAALRERAEREGLSAEDLIRRAVAGDLQESATRRLRRRTSQPKP